MKWRHLVVMSLASVCMTQPARAALADEPATARASDPTPWLMRIHDAASQQNFQGTLVSTSSGSAITSAHIAHYRIGEDQYERVESLDGVPRVVFRHGQELHTTWPEARVAVVEQRARLTTFPALLQGGGDRIAEHYDIASGGHGRVAGLDADVLRLVPRDGLRYGYRLWAERRSGLLLRADVVGEHGEVLESSAFSDVVIGAKPPPDAVLQQMGRLDGYRIARSSLQPTRLDAEGWRLPHPVAGFQQVDCVRRSVGNELGADAAPTAPPKVVQAIFADGLTYVSVFIEPYDAERHAKALMTAMGATQTLMRRQGDAWVTFVGDVPPAALRAFSASLEHAP